MTLSPNGKDEAQKWCCHSFIPYDDAKPRFSNFAPIFNGPKQTRLWSKQGVLGSPFLELKLKRSGFVCSLHAQWVIRLQVSTAVGCNRISYIGEQKGRAWHYVALMGLSWFLAAVLMHDGRSIFNAFVCSAFVIYEVLIVYPELFFKSRDLCIGISFLK